MMKWIACILMLMTVAAGGAATTQDSGKSRSRDNPKDKPPTTRKSPDQNQNPNQNPNQNKNQSQNKSVGVNIKNLQFQPATIRIKLGDTVVWSNNDDRDHTVNADDGSFASGKISAGDSFQFTFGKKGRFTYVCSYHPRMKAVVIVE